MSPVVLVAATMPASIRTTCPAIRLEPVWLLEYLGQSIFHLQILLLSPAAWLPAAALRCGRLATRLDTRRETPSVVLINHVDDRVDELPLLFTELQPVNVEVDTHLASVTKTHESCELTHHSVSALEVVGS